DAHLISHLNVEYDASDRLQDVTIDYSSRANDAQVMDVRFSSFMDQEAFSRLNDLWNRQPASVLFIEDYENTPISSPMLDFSKQNNIRSAVIIWARERGLVWELIMIGFANPQVFEERQRRQYEVLADQINVVLQTHRLLRETRSSASRLSQQIILLQTINQLTLTISSATDEKNLLDKSCRLMVETTNVDHCSIALLIPAETATQVVSEYPTRGTLGVYYPFGDNPLYEEMRHNRQPIVVTNMEQENRLPAASRHLFERLGVQSFWILPLTIQDKMIGSIGLNNYTPGKIITPEMVETTQSIAVQIGLGLQNIRLLADAQHRATQLQRITTFSQSAQATVDLPTILEKMLAETALMLSHDQMSISLYDWARNGLRTVAERVKNVNRVNLVDGEMIPISGHIAQVWDDHELLHIPDTHQQHESVDPNSQMRSWLVAPILTRDGAIGIVSVGNIHPYAYGQTDVALFEQMVTQLAVALENATAYTQSQRMVRNESLLNMISSQLQSQMSIETLMDAAVTELGRALGARQARIRLGKPDGSL
ncbi:MAG TPA: GAF domain-containing protein, partial [Phototrophicaceae bacterium]|nr:GAF domain-containing protein [Phototrophicaceae bacterium]